MRAQRFIGIAVVLFGGFALVGHIATQPPEPSYQGKPFSYWLTKVRRLYLNHQYDSETLKPFRAMGSNAVPFVLDELCARDFMPGARAWLRGFAYRNGSNRFRYETAAERKDRALAILESMGPSAAGAVPIVEGMVTNHQLTPHPGKILARMGTAGLLPLARSMNKTGRTDEWAEGYLWNFLNVSGDENVRVTTQFLAQKLNDPSMEVRAVAAQAATHVAWLPELLMPQLERCLGDPSPTVRREVVAGLLNYNARTAGRIDEDVPAFKNLMQRALTNSDDVVRVAATNALVQIRHPSRR